MTLTTRPKVRPCWSGVRLECFFHQFSKPCNIFMHLPCLKKSSVLMTSIKTQIWSCFEEISPKWRLSRAVNQKMPHFLFYTFLLGKYKINRFYPLEILCTHNWFHRESLWHWWIEVRVNVWILSACKKRTASTARKIGFHWFFPCWVTSMYHPLKATDNNPHSPKFYIN